jgi:hypothetical protein
VGRYEASWSVVVDIDEGPDVNSSELLMLAMHVFVESHRLSDELLEELRRIGGQRRVEAVLIRPLKAQKV